MKTEMELLQQLAAYMANNLNNHILQSEEFTIEEISAENILVDYPDTDSMKHSTMFYIVPDTETFGALTTCSDLAEMSITVFILCKKDKQENLIKKVFAYFSAFYSCIKEDVSLDSFVDTTNLASMEFYPAVEANKSIVGAEIQLNIQFTKDF
jgi:hypothetical protein